MNELQSFLFALFLGGILGWTLRGSIEEKNRKIRAKLRSKI